MLNRILLLKLTCLVLTLFYPFYVGKAPAKKGKKANNAAAAEDAEGLGECQKQGILG